MPASTPLSSGPRLRPRLKFVWGSSRIAAHWRLGFFGFYERIHGFPRSGFAISLRGALCWLVALGLVGYFGGAYALKRFLARNPYNQLRYVEVLSWPVRPQHVAEVRAKGWLAQGK